MDMPMDMDADDATENMNFDDGRSYRGIVARIMRTGEDTQWCDRKGWTVMHHASIGESMELIQCFVQKGVAVNSKNHKGETPLMLAARWSHKEKVELLINSGADIHCCDEHGWTVMHHASIGKCLDVIPYLVNKGVAVNKKNCKGETPLMLALERCHKENAVQLINSGADIHCCDMDGSTVLHHASIVDGSTVLHHASIEESVELVQHFVHEGVAVDKKNRKGDTPLMVAVQRSRTEIVEVLINSGADIHCYDEDGWAVLHHASKGGSVEVVRCLVKKSDAIDIINSKGETPLHVAITQHNMNIAEVLLKAGADCNVENHNGESPFSYLLKRSFPPLEIIKLCIEKGAYVKLTDYNKILENPGLKRFILRDVELCFHLVVNKFNNRDLPLLYKRRLLEEKLPAIDKMKMGTESGRAREVKQAVTSEIQARGFCNVLQMVPILLSCSCVRYFIGRP